MPLPEADRIVARLPDLVNSDAALVRRGQRLTTTFLLAVGDAEYLVRVGEGRLAAVERGPFLLRSWSFAVRASADAWRASGGRAPRRATTTSSR